MKAFLFFFKQRLCIFCQKLSNENKQWLYKIQKSPTSLFYHVLLIKQNEVLKNCRHGGRGCQKSGKSCQRCLLMVPSWISWSKRTLAWLLEILYDKNFQTSCNDQGINFVFLKRTSLLVYLDTVFPRIVSSLE